MSLYGPKKEMDVMALSNPEYKIEVNGVSIDLAERVEKLLAEEMDIEIDETDRDKIELFDKLLQKVITTIREKRTDLDFLDALTSDTDATLFDIVCCLLDEE